MYIRQEQLPRLEEYKYSGVDRSLLSKYILKPFYTHVAIKAFPMAMAPNAITLSGFAFVVLNFLTLLWYNPTLDQDCPAWVYVSWSVGLFLYQTFDAVDGAQARRTRQSGPLGELFDHGVDALNTTLEVLLFAATMNMGQSWKTVLVLFACLFTFYIQTWDEYHTHTLYLGLVSGPVEGIMTLIIVFGLTAMLGGGHFWQQSLVGSLGVSQQAAGERLFNLNWSDWFMGYGGVVLVFNTAQSTINVLKARRARQESALPALFGHLPYVILWIMVPLYLQLHPTILRHHFIPFALYVGLVNAYAVGQIIVAHITKAEFPSQNILVLPLLFSILDAAGPWLQEHIGIGWPSSLGYGPYQISFLFMSLGVAVGVYGSFVVDVIVAICDYLDIWCLSIKHPWTAETETKSATKETLRDKAAHGEVPNTDINGGPSQRLRRTNKKCQ